MNVAALRLKRLRAGKSLAVIMIRKIISAVFKKVKVHSMIFQNPHRLVRVSFFI